MEFYTHNEVEQDIVDGVGVASNTSALTVTLFIEK
jgi:hypothetical protein